MTWIRFKDIILLPLRFIFSHEKVSSWGLTSLKEERMNMCLRFCRGKVLDIGCGQGNELVSKYGDGIGVDIYSWDKVNILCDGAELPFKDSAFETVTFVACLNHIPMRQKAVKEAFRVLRGGGIVLITMINPVIGYIRHKLTWWDRDQHERGMEEHEEWGLWTSQVKELLEETGFMSIRRKPFLFFLNNLYMGYKRPPIVSEDRQKREVQSLPQHH